MITGLMVYYRFTLMEESLKKSVGNVTSSEVFTSMAFMCKTMKVTNLFPLLFSLIKMSEVFDDFKP
jgi:hypothetical protein